MTSLQLSISIRRFIVAVQIKPQPLFRKRSKRIIAQCWESEESGVPPPQLSYCIANPGQMVDTLPFQVNANTGMFLVLSVPFQGGLNFAVLFSSMVGQVEYSSELWNFPTPSTAYTCDQHQTLPDASCLFTMAAQNCTTDILSLYREFGRPCQNILVYVFLKVPEVTGMAA